MPPPPINPRSLTHNQLTSLSHVPTLKEARAIRSADSYLHPWGLLCSNTTRHDRNSEEVRTLRWWGKRNEESGEKPHCFYGDVFPLSLLKSLSRRRLSGDFLPKLVYDAHRPEMSHDISVCLLRMRFFERGAGEGNVKESRGRKL